MSKYCFTLLTACVYLALASCGSNNNKSEDKAPTAVTEKPDGAVLYSNMCATCHQSTGEGMGTIYPPLAKSDYMADKNRAIEAVVKGLSGDIVVNGKTYTNRMPAQQLTDDEAAAVLNYVYSSWGNTVTAVTADEVKAARNK